MSEVRINPGALTLPKEMIDQRDFRASEVVALTEGELPKSFSL